MHDVLEHMKGKHPEWYNYFIKESYHNKFYHRCHGRPGMPNTTNTCEKSHDLQKVRSNAIIICDVTSQLKHTYKP